jgi:hypothetical protein
MTERPVYLVCEVAELLLVSETTVRRLVAAGDLVRVTR